MSFVSACTVPPWTTVKTTSQCTGKNLSSASVRKWTSVNDKNSICASARNPSCVSAIEIPPISHCLGSGKISFISKGWNVGREKNYFEHKKKLQRGKWMRCVGDDTHYINHRGMMFNVRSVTGPHIVSLERRLYINRHVIHPFTAHANPSSTQMISTLDIVNS